MSDGTETQANTLFTVTDLKQYHYCPRVLYYQTVLPDVRPTTFKMEAGIRRHEGEQKRAIRRNLRLDGIEQAQRLFDVSIVSQTLGLSGQLDEVILFDDQLIVVDYKLSRKAGPHFKVQLAAYTLMAEEAYQRPGKIGLLYLCLKRESVEIAISSQLRRKAQTAIAQMQHITDSEIMPDPPKTRARCHDCEFRRFCNDV